ncbi:hypothetical protein LCGC14_1454020 [marine sediment metagenome]|uniref:Uncharacterized protein n=1 Tax=marine sediment metagenome TaxID=412755 RepID=A0A0F9JHP6_9ZZZZ
MADSTTTSIETVVTHNCQGAKGFWGELTLPRAESEDDVVSAFNEMVQQVEDRFNLLNKNAPVVTCIVDGAIILDCAHGSLFEVDLSEDVNSITIKNCDAPGQVMDVSFRGTTVDPLTGLRFISGWPDDIVCSLCGTAIEPTSVPIGNTFNQGFSTNRFGTQSSRTPKPGGDTDFDCVATCLEHSSMLGYPLESKIKVCVDACEKQPGGGVKGSGDGDGGVAAGNDEGNLDPCESISSLNVQSEIELDCTEATPLSKLRVCGGTPPYTWVIEGGEGTPEATLAGGWDQVITVKPPIGEEVSGVAYRNGLKVTNPASCPDGAFECANTVGCDGVEISGCTGPGSFPGNSFAVVCVTGGACEGLPDCAPCGTACSGFPIGNPLDKRTQQMIDDGCLPCALSMDGVTITVTDAAGASVVTVLST